MKNVKHHGSLVKIAFLGQKDFCVFRFTLNFEHLNYFVNSGLWQREMVFWGKMSQQSWHICKPWIFLGRSGMAELKDNDDLRQSDPERVL